MEDDSCITTEQNRGEAQDISTEGIHKAAKVDSLLDAGLNNTLLDAARYGRIEDIKRTVTSGADIEALDAEVSYTVHCSNVLWTLSLYSLFFVILRIQTGWTPLLCAACYDHTDIVAYLVSQGANLEAVNVV